MINLITDIKGTRFGNHMYFYLYASKNKNTYVDFDDDMLYWNKYFPKLNKFVKNNVDKYNKIVIPDNYFQEYLKDFNIKDINSFIRENIIEEITNCYSISYDLVINIRRGNFYSNYKFYYLYGFDQIKYIKDSIYQISNLNLKNVAVISDDIEWCKKNLSFIEYNFKSIVYLNLKPFESFIILVNAKNLIITNSTFSYWAAYINNYLNEKSTIFAPNYNTVLIKNGQMISALPNWKLIDVKRNKNIILDFLYKFKIKYKKRL